MQWLQHALHCFARNKVQCSTVQSDPVQCVQHSMCGAVQWSPIQCSAVRVTQWSGKKWSIAQCSAAQCSVTPLLSLAQFSSPRPALFSSDPHGDLLFPFFWLPSMLPTVLLSRNNARHFLFSQSLPISPTICSSRQQHVVLLLVTLWDATIIGKHCAIKHLVQMSED